MLASRLLENAASWDIDPWRAELDVRLGIRAGKTRLLAASHRGPLRVQRVFHPEGDGSAHLVLLHPPAGLVGGDALHVRAHVEAQASALLTTTGAGKAYRSAGRLASTLCELQVEQGACLEYVPQESVVYEGAHARMHTRVHIAPGAEFLGWEVVCLGRPACGERFERGRLEVVLEIERAGALVLLERARISGGDEVLSARWGLASHAAFGTMVATAGDVDTLRDSLASCAPGASIAVTRVDELVVVRAMGRDGLHVRALLERARHHVRDAWKRPRVDPGIWRS